MAIDNALTFKQELSTHTKYTNISDCKNRHSPDMEIRQERSQVQDISEDAYMRFDIGQGVTESFPIGTVTLGKVLIIRSNQPLLITVTNPYGTFQFQQGQNATSVMHMQYTAITAQNLGVGDATGYYYSAGD